MGGSKMAYTLIDTIQVKNISAQVIPINIAKLVNSPIQSAHGNIQLTSQSSIEAEDNRFDISQLRSLRDKKLITTESFRRRVNITSDSSAGTDVTSGTS